MSALRRLRNSAPPDLSFREILPVAERGERINQDLKDRWSGYIANFVTLTIVFQIVLTWFVGTGRWNFIEYDWFLYIVIGENFLQIVGMGYIVANHLFPTGKRRE